MAISPAAPASVNEPAPSRLALGALLLGCALTLVAPFLPFVHVTYPSCNSSGYPGDCVPYDKTPVQDLLAIAQQRTTPTQIVFMAIFAFVLWGAPVILTALSARILLARRRAPSWRAGASFLILVAVGAALALIECVFYMISLDYIAKRTFTYGVGVTFLGYLLALLGAILLMTSAGTPAATPAGSPRARWLAGGALLLSLALPVFGQYPVIRIFHLDYAPLSLFGFPNLGYPWLGFWFLLYFNGRWLLVVVVALALTLLFVGAPIVLAILGTVTLSARNWIPGRRAVILGAVFTALGAGSALIGITLYIFPHLMVSLGLAASIPPYSGSPTPITMFEVIPMLLGYLAALVGVIWLPRISRPAQES